MQTGRCDKLHVPQRSLHNFKKVYATLETRLMVELLSFNFSLLCGRKDSPLSFSYNLRLTAKSVGPRTNMTSSKLPEWPSGTYERYKTDTGVFTDWLTAKAVQTGFKLDGQLEAPEVAAKSNSKRKEDRKNPVKVTVRQLLEAGQHVVQQKPPVPIPREAISAGQRAINARSKCS
jgi:hypothetical protein